MRYFSLFVLVITLFSCSKDSNSDDSFQISLDVEKTDVMLNEGISLKVLSSHPIETIYVEDYLLEYQMGRMFLNPPLTTNLHLAFGRIGEKTITVVVTDKNEEVTRKAITFNVKKPQNVVKITSIKVNSFKDFGGIYDSEYPDNDPNRLADVKFKLLNFSHDLYNDLRLTTFYESSIRYNQENLFWDLTDEELYVDLNQFSFGLYDDDDGFNEASFPLYHGEFGEHMPVYMSMYQTDKPAKVVLSSYDNFEIELGLEWPN
ncbi:MAG: hypothetical protein V4670_08555 [Bacteroidota bacterium]